MNTDRPYSDIGFSLDADCALFFCEKPRARHGERSADDRRQPAPQNAGEREAEGQYGDGEKRLARDSRQISRRNYRDHEHRIGACQGRDSVTTGHAGEYAGEEASAHPAHPDAHRRCNSLQQTGADKRDDR